MSVPLTPDQIAYQEAHINEDQGPLVLAVSGFLIGITTIVVGLRIVARHVKAIGYGWDDIFAVGGLIFTILMCVINIISVKYGLGKHLLATNPKQGYIILEAGFFLSLVYALGQWFIKMSIMFLYIRLFTTTRPWFKYCVYVCIFYVSGWALGLIITILTQCRPLSYFWDQYNISLDPPATGQCTINSSGTEISTSALNSVTDFALLILPIIIVWNLQLDRRRKIALVSLFMVGTFACIAGIFRLASTTTAISVTSDSTWNAANVYIWTAVEASVGLICGCFPAVGPLAMLAYTNVKSLTGSIRSKLSSEGSRNPQLDSNFSGGLPWSRLRSAQKSDVEMTLEKTLKKPSSVRLDLIPLDESGRVVRTDEVSIISSSHV